jgi:hypothetical protein
MRQVFDEGGHVDHRLAREHAEPEIVEIKKLHVFPLWIPQAALAISADIRPLGAFIDEWRQRCQPI